MLSFTCLACFPIISVITTKTYNKICFMRKFKLISIVIIPFGSFHLSSKTINEMYDTEEQDQMLTQFLSFATGFRYKLLLALIKELCICSDFSFYILNHISYHMCKLNFFKKKIIQSVMPRISIDPVYCFKSLIMFLFFINL